MKYLLSILLAFAVAATSARSAMPEQTEFFEKKIRPVLSQHCYSCHNSLEKQAGGLALDYRDALLAGGDSGDVIVPGKPQESILIWALRHEQGYEMPSNAPQLDAQVIRDFERWIEQGASDPRRTKPTAEQLREQLPWEQVRQQRLQWWAFQPLQQPSIPAVNDEAWASHPIDRFVHSRMQQAGLMPQPPAAPEVLVRRVHQVLTGLPPAPQTVAQFTANPTPEAYSEIVDNLLASKAFGERWAGHWMDWYRYAESHGSEGDPRIPYAQQYRDYLIRALNDDVPYDQLLREHLAGDLLQNPRINPTLQINESAIGPAHLRMVPHGFGVTDAYGEQIAFTDNQIDVISKAMLGVTVSCARCHDHKFDPISQQDFYRFYGVLVSCRPASVLVDSPEKLDTNKAAMRSLKQQIRQRFAEHWLTKVSDLRGWLENYQPSVATDRSVTHPLGTWALLRDVAPEDYKKRIAQLVAETEERQAANARAIANAEFYVDLRDPQSASAWKSRGNGTASVVSRAGAFALQGTGETAIRGVYPRGIFTHLLSDKHAATFSSRDFVVRGKATFVRVAGQDAQLRAPVRNYPLIQGLHPADVLQKEQLSWVPTQRKWKYWQGDKVHYELCTDQDKLPRPGNKERSWFGITEILAGDQPPQPAGAPLVSLIPDPLTITNRESLAAAYVDTLQRAVEAWRDETINDAESEFLDAFLQAGFLANRIDQLPTELQQSLAQYRELENAIPNPTRAPGVLDADSVDQPLLVRGDPKQEAEPVPRQFLEIFHNRRYADERSGRLELANDMVSEANTLKTRVLINRLWAYVFGRGIVASTDNLGRLGQKPTHPELLDHLALDFEHNGWSMKHALRQMVTSRTFQSSSQTSAEAREKDEQNLYLSHFTPRRLDADAIYDSIVSLQENQSRAVYLPVIRNQLNPFLSVFNAPIPTTTVSLQTPTNVPAQSLTMMNGDLVDQAARHWSSRIANNDQLSTPDAKITAMFQQAYARSPQADELEALLAYRKADPADQLQIEKLAAEQSQVEQQRERLGQDLAALLVPIEQRLQQEVDLRNAAAAEQGAPPIDLQPIARWDFETDVRDSIGSMHGRLEGDARIEDGTLVLAGGCLLTAPLTQTLQAKTMEVLLELDDLDQQGGGAFTVQSLDGNVFDSIVFAEALPRKWLFGSNNFFRTVPLDGAKEDAAVKRPVHIVMTHAADGTVQAFRDGKPYAASYRKSDLLSYQAGKAQIAFGLRHGTQPTPRRMLTGRIHQARLYDRALTSDEVAALAAGSQRETVTRKMLLTALTPAQRQTVAAHEAHLEQLQQTLATIQQQRRELQNQPRLQNDGYYGVAHALLNSKEFIYVH